MSRLTEVVATNAPRVLLAVHTVADWGGLQDWTVGMVKGLSFHGAEVVLVSNNARVIGESAGFVASSFLVDWDHWEESVDDVLSDARFDVIFSQPFKAREFALEIRRKTGVPLVYMAHGNNSDFAYTWRNEVSKFLVASSSLRPMLQDFCLSGQIPVEVLPNGVPSSLFDQETVPFDDRIELGTYDFVLAARLMPDKLSQVDGLITVVSSLIEHGVIPRARVHVMGGGPSKSEFMTRLADFALRIGNVEVEFHGWVGQDEVIERLRTAVFSVAGGVTGAQSVALGTPCLGAGIRGVCGVSTPANMDGVLGSNFGDHSARFNMSEGDIAGDARWILQRENFEEFQRVYVPLMRTSRTHEAIAQLALQQISDVVEGRRLGVGAE